MNRTLTTLISFMLMVWLFGCGGNSSTVSNQSVDNHQTSSVSSTTMYLHGSGGTNNPPNLYLDSTAPTGSQTKYKDSTGVHFSGGNPWVEVGVWTADANVIEHQLTDLSPLHVWAGLKNSDDVGTHFDVRAEVWQNYSGGTLVGAGEVYDIDNLVRNASLAREITVSFADIIQTNFNGATDILSLRILTRIGTDGNSNFAGGHSSATGLRVYFDSTTRMAEFGATTRINEVPVAVANAEPTSGTAPLTVSFSATGSYDPDGTIVTYEWDLDDGNGFQDYTSTGGATSHVYTDAGSYTTTLRVTDNDGAVTTATTTIETEEANAQGDWCMFGRDAQHTRRSPYAGPTTNHLRWSYLTGAAINSSPALAADGTIYVGGWDKKLYALTPEGTLKWSYLTGDHIESSPAVGSDGTVYVGSYDSNLYAIDSDGNLKWSYQTGNAIGYSPTIGSDATVYVCSGGGRLYAIRPDGTLKWYHNNAMGMAPALNTDGIIYICGNQDGSLHAIRQSDGSLRWSYWLGNAIFSAAAVTPNGSVYVGGWDQLLHAIGPDGNRRWAYVTGGLIRSSAAIGSDGAVYVGSYDAKVYAINQDGSLRWTYTTGGGIWCSPAIDANGTVYIGSADGKFQSILTDGTLGWSYSTGANIYSSPAIGDDGTIYVGSDDGRLYAFGPDNT